MCIFILYDDTRIVGVHCTKQSVGIIVGGVYEIGIIEDDNLLRKALDTSLKNQGYTTILAGSRKEAIKNIDSSVDLLIVDIGLPDGDGINLYQELQKNGRIPAIFLTAKDDEKDMLKAFDTGADDYVVKPFSIKVLLKAY